jgi:aspartyl-tRNA(Asn)/glutamyl-tRNA(Gln) amidotransferase subunit A
MSYTEDRSTIIAGGSTVRSTVETFLTSIEEQSSLHAFLHVNTDGVRCDSDASDERFAAGLARPLEGLVVAVKDNISVTGQPLTCASRMLEGFGPLYNATVIERLMDAGALVIGKTNMDEFAMGSSNETSAFGIVRNSVDPSRVPGGSSGGSAVAVSGGMCHVSLGSDTGGSIRQPAAFTGTYGLKPTYGRISRYGLVAFASSLDQIGIFSRTLPDMQATFDIIAGYDQMDATSVKNVSPLPSVSADQLRIAALPVAELKGCDPDIIAAYAGYLDALRATGAVVEEVSLPYSELWIPTYFILATAEASSNLARFDGVRYGLRAEAEDGDITTASRSAGFGPEVQRRIMLGTFVLSAGYGEAYYTKAQQARRLISDAYAKVFATYHAFALPTTPTTAFGLGEVKDPVSMWLSDYFTVSANIAGIPALSLPFGTDSKGLPIGMQLQGPMFGDERIMHIAESVSAAR